VLEFRDPLPVLVAFSLEQVAPIQSRRAPDAQKFSSPPDLNTHAARTHARGPSVRRPAPRADGLSAVAGGKASDHQPGRSSPMVHALTSVFAADAAEPFQALLDPPVERASSDPRS